MNAVRVGLLVGSVAIVLLLLAGGALVPSVVQVRDTAFTPHPPGTSPPGLGGLAAPPPPPTAGVLAKCVVKSSPVFDAYDPVNHYVYVSTLSGYVVVLNDSLAGGACHVKTNIALPTGAAPRGLAFDPSDGQMYVVDGALNQVYILNGTKLKDTISNTSCLSSFYGCHFFEPHGIAYDADDGYMYVTNQGDGTVTLMAPSDQYVLDATFGIGGLVPTEIAYSPYADQMVVTDYGSSELSVFSGGYATAPSVSLIPVGSDPYGVAFNPFIAGQLANAGTTFVADYGSGNVTVTCAICAGGTSSITVGSNPLGLAFDQVNLYTYVTNYGSHSVSVIGGVYGSVLKTIKLPTGSFPAGIVYDDLTGDLFVVGVGTDTVYVVS